jgi:hypothetical protein
MLALDVRSNCTAMFAYDTSLQFNYLAGARPQGRGTGCNLSPHDIDVTAQIIYVIREGQRKADMAHGVLNAVEFGLFRGQVFVVRIGVERSLQ